MTFPNFVVVYQQNNIFYSLFTGLMKYTETTGNFAPSWRQRAGLDGNPVVCSKPCVKSTSLTSLLTSRYTNSKITHQTYINKHFHLLYIFFICKNTGNLENNVWSGQFIQSLMTMNVWSGHFIKSLLSCLIRQCYCNILQGCALVFGAWSYHTTKMNLSNSNTHINLDSYERNGEWEILSTKVSIKSLILRLYTWWKYLIIDMK